ncbi:MAG: beta-galactosidase, partial [Clostridia bacterium]|nr:beta-galactosidase [Clostridia bacterium]
MRKLQYIGKLKKTDIAAERLGIGFEKLDRAVFEPERAYEKLGEIGIKWVRLQSGWARTEKEPGVYDFTWLDDIVDNLIRRGMQPWICLCYGNALYDDFAKTVFGA